MVKLYKIESDSMIDLNRCNQQADIINDVSHEVSSLIKLYDEAQYYTKKNQSNDSSSFSTSFYNETIKLMNIRNDLSQIERIIRTKAQEIYNEELAEQKRKEAEKLEQSEEV